MKQIKKNMTKILLLLFLITICWGYLFSLSAQTIKDQTYVDFITSLELGKVVEVQYQSDSPSFTYTDKDGDTFKVSNPKTDDFKLILLESGVEVTEIKDNSNLYINIVSMLTSLLSIGLILFFISRTLNKTIGKGKDNKLAVLPNVKLKDVAGMKEVKKDISILIEFLKNPKMFHEKGAKMPRGIILYGEPGTGKTLLVKAIAGEAGVPFFSIAGSDFVEMFVGLGAKRVRELFEKARATGPCIIFIDEIDAVGRKRGGDNNSEKDQTINALLAELDGFSSKDEILVMAATNRLEDLDPALIRSGRFDKHIKVPLPLTKEERRAIIDIHKTGKKFDETVDFNQLAKMTIGMSGADIANILNESVIDSIMHAKEMVDNESLDNAFYKVVLRGHRKENNNPETSEKETRLIAYHEAGHALTARLLCKKSVPMVTIIGTTTGAGGFTISLPDDNSILTKREIENKVIECYAGRVAEELAGFEKSTGAANDIEQATQILYKMYSIYGMGSDLINLNILDKYKIESNDVLREIKCDSSLLYLKTRQFLNENKILLDALALALIERETLDERELDAIIHLNQAKAN